jgi:hypothetical protein
MSSLTYTIDNNNSNYSSSGYGNYQSENTGTYNALKYISDNTTNYSHINQIYQANRTMHVPQSSTYYSRGGRVEISIYGR